MTKWGQKRLLMAASIVFLAIGLFFFFSFYDPAVTEVRGEKNDTAAGLHSRLQDAVVLYTGSPLALVNNAEKQVDGDNVEIVPYVKEGRVLVPLRFIAQNLRAEIAWDKDTSAVTLSVGKNTVGLQPGKMQMTVNEKTVKLDIAPEIADGRTFVPLRAISEAFGKKVFYDRGLIVIGEKEKPFDKDSEKSLLDQVIAKVNNLPAVGSAEKLSELLAGANEGQYFKQFVTDDGMLMDMVAMESEALRAASPQQSVQNTAKVPQMQKEKKIESSSDGDYSKTNVQVQGVDEADLVKTDGEYLYYVNKQRVLITKAYPAEKMQIVSTITFKEKDFCPEELYLDEQYLVVIGRNTLNDDYILKPMPVVPQDQVQPDTANNTSQDIGSAVPQSAAKRLAVWPPYNYRTGVKVFIYDIRDKTKITKLREVELEGNYLTSRKIGSYLYFVANCPTFYYGGGYKVNGLTGNGVDGNEEEVCAVPFYRDTAMNNDYQAVPYEKIYYIPPIKRANYLVIAGLNLNRQDDGVQISTYLGAGDNVYVSEENLFVALQRDNYGPIGIMRSGAASSIAGGLKPENGTVNGTQIYKFSLDQGKITYLSKGEVPGTLLNQFSMDEHKGYFRVATTTGNTWSSGKDMSQNNVYVLDDSMSLVGMVEDIAPGERIYSARFMGDRAYLVTFKDTDPFFVLDLKAPTNPRILGALKIPGYSDYLHPYDENHIIGIGKDTIEVPVKGREASGNTVLSQAYYQGMKLAVFDVTDVTKPRELFKEVIGDRGTDSELLRNHKALLFDREKELLAFPVRVMEVPEAQKQGNPNAVHYGQFTFQGAYVYKLNLTNGFTLSGKITHLTKDDLLKAGYNYADPEKEIKRILYIGDTLYTLSDGMIKANGLGNLEERNSLLLQ